MNAKVTAALRRVAADNDGLLLPEDVVAAARPRSSPLHSKFQWNDGKAAREYRLWQARQLIKVVVETLPGASGTHEVFVSLTPDRRRGGYRVLAEVLSDAQLRAQLLEDALAELDLFRRKYRRLTELASVFAAAARVRRRRKR